MKKLIISTLLIAFGFALQAQDIKGDYCELVEFSAFGKTAFAIYHNDQMDALVDEKGEKVTSKLGITKALNVLSERGWEVAAVYESNKGGTKYLTYLMKRKDKK